jgi:hypothetical protein
MARSGLGQPSTVGGSTEARRASCTHGMQTTDEEIFDHPTRSPGLSDRPHSQAPSCTISVSVIDKNGEGAGTGLPSDTPRPC